MYANPTLPIGCLVERIASRLPNQAGSTNQVFEEDGVLQITRDTLLDLSKKSVHLVLRSLFGLLEDLVRPFARVAVHPPHILEAELYILSLVAASCKASRQYDVHEHKGSQVLPGPLDPLLVKRMLQTLSQLLEPIKDDHILPAQTLLGQLPDYDVCIQRCDCTSDTNHTKGFSETHCVGKYLVELDAYIKTTVEFVSASNWCAAFEHVKNTIHSTRTTSFPGDESEHDRRPEGEATALTTFRLLSFFWIDRSKLGLIIHEICSSYLHFRKPYQSTIAVVLPLLVTRWIDRCPHEFVQLHSDYDKLDGGVDTLFDMTHTGVDNGRRKAVLYPMQITLLLLLPGVFEVAINLREAKSNNLIKKVSFLNGIRKALRNGNERAAYCLVALLRAARHFEAESDSALVSYAMDIHDEIRDSVFCLSHAGNPILNLDQDMITAAFVSLAHLDPNGGVETLTNCCVSPNAPNTYKIAVIQAFGVYEVFEFQYRPFAVGRAKLFADESLASEMIDQPELIPNTRKRLWDQICVDLIQALSNIPADASAAAQEASLKLESTLLVSLCSPVVSVCQAATACVGLIVGDYARAGVYSDTANFLSSIHRNNLVYQQVSSSTLESTGPVAFQKRLWSLLRQMRIPTRGILDAWKLVFERWLHLLKDVSIATAESFDDALLSQWRNLLGFLVSSGGICTHGYATRIDDAFEELQWIDKLFAEQHEEPLLTRFLRLSVQHLGCQNSEVREAMREVLSTEVSSMLYPALFHALESELEVLLAGAHASVDQNQERELTFADQAASLLKTMVEKLESPIDFGSVSSVHLAALTLSFAKFVDGAPDSITALRLRIKISHLCEAVLQRKDHLNLRDDVSIRNQLLEHISDWISRPFAPEQDRHSNTGSRLEEFYRVQKDLDKACLTALADVTLRLPLQPIDNQTGAGTSELKSQMFHMYFNRFLSLLKYETQESNDRGLSYNGTSRDETISNADLVIKILSNLLSANIDVGLKHSLNIGYHENAEIRAAFVRVLCNTLTKGTEFNSLTDSAVNEKYTQLLHKVLERLMLTSRDLDLELDPARVGDPKELQKNAAQLQIVAKVFMEDICASVANVPSSFRRICNIISEAVLPRFPNAKYTAVGAFVFLRFFCPAIVAPETDHLVSASPTKEMRRGLLLIAKIIQNLANNVLFGTKEPYMFPLNPFLVQNIHVVTGFLREISVSTAYYVRVKTQFASVASDRRYQVPLQQDVETPTKPDTIDFGSCISLHRFFYEHWDHLRQTLVSLEKKEHRVSGELARSTPPSLEPLRRLITNLGPPPLAISWNRPQISFNSPPLYSRFQNFMLRNASRSGESFLTSRAVYDGGESKADYEMLLYCYLKSARVLSQTQIASRLWHQPFGLLIDATCYNGRIEPADDFFSKLEVLTPSELARNLSRIYIYNMNSAFNVFHPKNVEYHLFGSLSDLQIPFYLNQLHLPQETISVVTETRFMFESITRLSKSKGEVDVVIKIGNQFVQITTVKKQEVLSGCRISSIINDIFRLSDVDEATTIAALQADNDSSFGLRADGGRTIMFFSSPQRADILQTIRGAKAKLGKDNRFPRPAERLVRPQDVPGTMLNLALTNLSSPYHALRLASYNLLGALCRSFDFSSVKRLVCNEGLTHKGPADLAIPLDPTRFIVSISKDLALAEPQITSDFLAEFFVSWESIPEEQKPLSLEYVAPWLSGLRSTVLVADIDGEKGREKVASFLRKLIEVAVLDPSLTFVLEQYIWPSISQDEPLLDIFVDELIKIALGYSTQPDTLEVLSSVMTGLGTITLRARIICRLRKALNRSSLRPTRQLPDNMVWEEVQVLLRFCLALSFDNRVQSQMFLPEVFHLITMLANWKGGEVGSLVYKLLINSVHAICVSFSLDDLRALRLRSIMEIFANSRGEIFAPPLSFASEGASASTNQESNLALITTEKLMDILYEVCSIAAPSVDVANAWRARWMSLVASTAFQNNPAIQPRAFTILGYLAKEEVDDDLLYQVLVALRNSVRQCGEDGNSEMLLSIITSLTNLMPKLPSASRYGFQLFWLAISLLRLVPASLFDFTAQFLDAVLKHIGSIGNVKGDRMVVLLLHSRTQLEEAVLPLDNAYGIHFEHDTFHFAVCACLVRGLMDTATRPSIKQALLTLGMIFRSAMPLSKGPEHTVCQSPYLALLLAFGMTEDDLIDSVWWHDLKPRGFPNYSGLRSVQGIEKTPDKDLFLLSVIELIGFHYLDDAGQARSLHWLIVLAQARSSVFTSLCGALPSIIDDVLLHSQDTRALEAAHALLRTISSEQRYCEDLGSLRTFLDLLDEIGFGGLWREFGHLSSEAVTIDCFELTQKLIE
ncbi:hypothetical protein E4U60_006050, partial [Claviceps pazoutovae]